MESRVVLAAAVAALFAGAAAAQEFPSRTVKIVMGFGPGGLGRPAQRARRRMLDRRDPSYKT